jgi:hypothetical protein
MSMFASLVMILWAIVGVSFRRQRPRYRLAHVALGFLYVAACIPRVFAGSLVYILGASAMLLYSSLGAIELARTRGTRFDEQGAA